MRVFQNIGLYPAYLPRIEKLWAGIPGFDAMRRVLIDDRFGGVHYLKPVIDGDPDCFFAVGDNEHLQRQWAREAGMSGTPTLDDILLAQIEAHATDVFYNLDPVRYDNAFLKRLPGCVKRTIAWRAAPSGNAQFLDHDLVVNNYPSLADRYRAQGARTGYFFPSHDPAMDAFADNQDRPIDVLFIGGYSRHHLERAAALEAVSLMTEKYNVVFNLDVSRATRLAETPVGLVGPLRKLRRPRSIRTISSSPVFGLDMYRQIARAKVVINGKVDIAGPDRGNMRVWETLGCGAALITDMGRYPPGMVEGRDFSTYNNKDDLLGGITALLDSAGGRKEIADNGARMVRTAFSKEVQWEAFQKLCA